MRAADLGLLVAILAIGAVLEASAQVGPETARRCAPVSGTVLIPAGKVAIGEDGVGRPGVVTLVPAFRIDRTEVTNGDFAAFVAATGHVTEAERQGSGAVFVQPKQLERGLDDPRGWWRLTKGASWRHPQGPASGIEGHDDWPVVQVTYADAAAYARWKGGALPTEDQWERAARGTQAHPRDPHDWPRGSDGQPAANVWDGLFPLINTQDDGFVGVAPVGCYAPNGLGLYDMIGNVWEWTRAADDSPGPLRGGSFLCSRNYCANYRPAGFQIQERDLATSHAGFRVVYPA